MASEYFKPMLDVGSPRVLNCNVLTRRLMAKEPTAQAFFRNKPMNNMVLIKDTIDDAPAGRSSIGTKLYFPFNQNDVYEGGRTIFAHDKHLEAALKEIFGEGGVTKEALEQDIRVLSVLDRLPSMDPFLLKDVFINEKIDIHESYFEVGKEFWNQIELFILQKFEPLIRAAFPDAMASDERSRKLIENIWECHDLEVLGPLATALRLPKGEELQIFSAWKGINFYSFQSDRARPLMMDMLTWLKELKIPVGAVPSAERNEIKAMLELIKTQVVAEWRIAETVLREYQDAYDKMFKHKVSSTEFLAFMKRSNTAYWALGNALGKVGHASYCWDAMSKRFPERKLPWEQLTEVLKLLAKIFKPTAKAATGSSW
jgi:hypothetical protein